MPDATKPVARSTTANLKRALVGSVGVRVAANVLTLLATVILVRLLGASGYGAYSYAYVIIMVLAIPAQLGWPTLMVREMAKLNALKDWSTMRGLLVRSNHIVLLWSIGLALAGWGIISLVGGGIAGYATMAWSFALLPFLALGAVRGAALRGLHRVALGQLPEHALRPAFLIIGIGLVAALMPATTLTPALAMGIHVAAAAIAFGIGSVLLLRNVPKPVRHAAPNYDTKRWLDSILPLSLLLGLQIIFSQVDTLILGLFRSTSEVGVYRAVVQAIFVVTFGSSVAAAVLGPNLAALHARKQTRALQNLVTMSSRAVLMSAFVPALIFVLFHRALLENVFGPEFIAGGTALIILCIGRVIGALVGPVGLLMNMTGLERGALPTVMVAAAINTILNFLLVPKWGIVGAAIGSSVGFAYWNLALAWKVYQRLGIVSLPLNIVSARGLA